MKRWILLSVGLTGVSALIFAEQKAVDPGKKVFDAKCVACHGADGKGKPAMAKMFKVEASALDLAATKKSDDEILKIIADGKNKMPAYSKQLKAEEIKSVLNHVKSLAPKKAESKPVEKPEVAAP